MRRFHVHVHVDDLARNIAFYNAMFGQQPARTESAYAKWMLDDPPVNFAISSRGRGTGVDHLGIQVDNEEDLAALKARAASADLSLQDEGMTTCCYARSDKYWVTDPQGVAWEQFHTLESIPTFSDSQPHAGGCCAAQAGPDVKGPAKAACC